MSQVDSDYQVFRRARDIVRNGWIKHVSHIGDRSCMGRALMQASGRHYWELSTRTADIVYMHMKHLPVFTLMYQYYSHEGWGHGSATIRAIACWNDAPWRTKHSVVKLLNAILVDLADEEIARLNKVVEELRAEKVRLETRINALQSENATLRQRIASFFLQPADKSALQDLSDELDKQWNELQQVGV